MENVGVYVHVPFCDRVCPYCDFAVVATRVLASEREGLYVDALLAELEERRSAFAGRRLASLYLGGGTPSLLTPASVARLVEAIRASFPAAAAEPEVTLEMNPGTLERERLPGFREAGVSRVSIGVQSFSDATLKRLGRAHAGDEARASLAAARAAGFANLSVDLILAAPGQGPAEFAADLEEALAFAPEHLSTYELTIEPGTPFALAAARGQLRRADEDAVLDMLDACEARLTAAGYRRYEISNYAKPGFEAVHNRRYWLRRPVLGLGVGAFSTDPPRVGMPHGVRRANPRDLAEYERAAARGAFDAAADVEVLTPQIARGEAVFLGLRAADGVDAARFAGEFGEPPRGFWPDAIDACRREQLLDETAAGDLKLTAAGRRLADTVFRYFV
ncbi:MAG: radical SAM family heme chaperone HemW [Deltaproteobacteria bacterium]|nr:radical SAM family heme chaperone HemW [Deltaproteobacteria bacterium]MBW2359825.1 radical SAM family heme chaperone HemW [Deltaproteobacteria bacterium]